MSMKNNWPTTVEELVDECEWLKCRYDLYTLGKRDEPFLGKGEPMIDGTDYLAGEYQYGIAMVPAQWVTHVLSASDEPDAATVGAGTCHMRLAYEEEDADGCIWPDHYECDACGAKVNGIMPFCDTEIPPKHCPNCGAKVVNE